MVSKREHASARLRWLRDQTPPLPAPQHWMEKFADTRRRQAEQIVREHAHEHLGPEVFTGQERADLAAWLTRIGDWWTPQSTLAALDDLVAGLDLDAVLRICTSEGFELVAETDRDGDRFVFLLDSDGLLAVVYLARGKAAPPEPWSLTLYGNRLIEDIGLATLHPIQDLDRHDVLSDGRWIVGGSIRWHLRYASSTNGSFRASLALLRAASDPITPWQHPAITTWIGPDAPHGMINAPHEDIVRVARAHTRDTLAQLPDHVRAVLGPRPMPV